MSTGLSLMAPAKLNLFLHITGRRADGYHELQTLFQLLDWGDTLTITADHSGEIHLSGDTLGLAPEDNLIVRAARALRHGDRGARIHVDKRIPSGGGLGGGSSDAATTLLALNQLWDCGLSNAELQAAGLPLGADVPLFVAGHSAWAEGIGERLRAVELPENWYLLIHPGCHVPTGEIFSARELTRNSPAITMAAVFQGAYRNDCQEVVARRYPEVAKALNWLAKFGESRLTGTGACVFSRFDSQASAEAVAQQVPESWQAYVARGINRSPALSELS
ncbi:4-(cytidine 5'-diphospho)-2-C-methyl-D-erythritol kinase [Parahaliea aestuarii]|uniref:4-diphosphocytidyl-2-C-methyl-D-erythritol kinase n=1 Tax=Parahaliea aestuarii TaxID=1852021 RepID=A0A5C9A558_9GAMM|nr:4-(cytidine 5'-diphospho)-2-C-methyl-D-erythritol kinase [Parahaliea aestuarii]TXS94870.1 4-(cytidine 5'-diphospho)-2-C-methyl-D-erythritol kinase [Parahaliea aestuarii]